MPTPNCQSLRSGRGFRRQAATVDERDDAEIAAERLQADARFEGELGQAAAADRVAIDVVRSEPLITIAAHRAAAARIEAPRRGDVIAAGAKDRAEANAPRGDNAVRQRMIGAGVDLGARIGEGAAVETDFRADPAAETEAPGRVEQVVAAVIAQGRRDGADEEGLAAFARRSPRSCLARRWRSVRRPGSRSISSAR